jgi:hypothetical protein
MEWTNIAAHTTKKFPKIDKKVKGTTFTFFHFLTIFDDFWQFSLFYNFLKKSAQIWHYGKIPMVHFLN